MTPKQKLIFERTATIGDALLCDLLFQVRRGETADHENARDHLLAEYRRRNGAERFQVLLEDLELEDLEIA